MMLRNKLGAVEIVDLRSYPLDEELIERVKLHGKCIVLGKTILNSFAQLREEFFVCFQHLDAPVKFINKPNPAVPMNMILEKAMLPSTEKVAEEIERLLNS
jgi:2-oxoisovalerate dehydrogenase E1 component